MNNLPLELKSKECSLSRKQSKKYAQILKRLPDAKLLSLVQTQDQLQKWIKLRGVNHLVSDCFLSRICMRDDPIFHLKQTKTGQLQHLVIWLSVDFYESLWKLIQMSFGHIKQRYIKQKNHFPFLSAWDLFLEITKFRENSTFVDCLQPSSNPVNLKRDSKIAKLCRKSLWSSLSSEEEEQLNNMYKKISQDKEENYWLNFIYLECKDLSKSNYLVASYFKNHEYILSSLADLINKVISDNSKNRLGFKLTSTWWIDGQIKKGQQAGGCYS